MLDNYFKPTPQKIQKLLLGLKTLIGTISIAKYFDGYKDAAFWFLVSGAILDFLLNMFKDNDSIPTSKTVAVIIVVTGLLFTSCTEVKPAFAKVPLIDSTWRVVSAVNLNSEGDTIPLSISAGEIPLNKPLLFIGVVVSVIAAGFLFTSSKTQKNDGLC